MSVAQAVQNAIDELIQAQRLVADLQNELKVGEPLWVRLENIDTYIYNALTKLGN